MIKTKPWWLTVWPVRGFVPLGAWVTISPVVYVPQGVVASQCPAILAHENVHLSQQEAYGKWRWLWRYIWRGAFMLQQEAEAVAAEVMASPAGQREAIIQRYVELFANKDGAYETADNRTCADSKKEAEQAIRDEIAKLGGGA